ncbi:phosphatase PAP2 family protein [Labedella endophytica]|jgi:membrane-associated phospholipid phosphatase|uniref:Phosphatase PAP2 family protein n=1 Tax=Labedella endophytica TaxID=1523160 RepID=A0A3S0XQM8_9MICO|nr:phosphatase PAP2 family protein [Labedella endophytica]RUR03379.1 phosphatase PAP2 family protein [Labedella endophytica]
MTATERAPREPLPLPRSIEPDARRSVALLVGIAAIVAFVALRLVVASGGHRPLPIDVWWRDLMLASVNDPLIALAWIPGIVGGTLGMIIVGLVIILLFLWRRRPWDAVTLAAAMVAVVAIGAPMAAIIARARPESSLAESVATSFPSGHTAVATTAAVVLGLLLRHGYVWALGSLWVILMMWSRTYLRAHWLSDVIAGMLEGVVVATLVWCVVEAVRDRRAARSTDLTTTDPLTTDTPTERPTGA